jgi:hypothetical protein
VWLLNAPMGLSQRFLMALPDQPVQNHSRHPSSRRYSRETLIWARHIDEISPQAWKAVRKALALPGK